MKRLQNIFTKVHFGQGGSSGDPTLIFHFSQDGKLIMAEIMNRNYRSAPSSPNRTRNLSLVKKLFSFNKLVQFKIVSTSFLDVKRRLQCMSRKKVDKRSNIIKSSFRL